MKRILLCTPKLAHPEYWKLFEQAFISLGYEVSFFNDDTDSLVWCSGWKVKQFDLFFSTVWPGMVSVPFNMIQKLAKKTVLWVTGGGYCGLSKDYQRYVADFDNIFSNSKYWFDTCYLTKYRSKFKSMHLGYDNYGHSYLPSNYDISFVGTIYPPRLEYLRWFKGLPLHLWAPRWDQWQNVFYDLDCTYHGCLDSKQMMQVFCQSKLVFNPIYKDALNMRLFECGFAGIPQLCFRTQELQKHFIDEEDLLMVSSVKELRDKVFYYLNKADELAQIGQNMKDKCQKYHLLSQRLEDMLQMVGER